MIMNVGGANHFKTGYHFSKVARKFRRVAVGGWLTLGIVALLPLWVACSNKEEPETKATNAPQLVGRIASIPSGKRFVLIQSHGEWTVTAGTILTTRGEEARSANLLVTGESLGNFAAADIQSGEVAIGDTVYSRHVPKPVTPSPEPTAPESGPSSPKPSSSEPSLPEPSLPEPSLPEPESDEKPQEAAPSNDLNL